MFIAKDKDNNRISINDIKENEKYFCEMCDEEVFVWAKNSKFVATHFSHKKGSNCVDWESRDMSEWHKNWQNQFPIECQEVVLKKDDVSHRADVLINNFVVEFQHSDISYQDFKNRNEFYTSLGYHIIWVFDASNKTKELNILNEYVWKRTQNQFQNFDDIRGNVEIYFEVDYQGEKVLLNSKELNSNYFKESGKIEIENFIYIITEYESLKKLQGQDSSSKENYFVNHDRNYPVYRGPKIDYVMENRIFKKRNNYYKSYRNNNFKSSQYRKK